MHHNIRRLIDRLQLQQQAIWWVFALFWLPIVVFLGIAREVLEGENLPFDVPLLRLIHGLSVPWLDVLVKAITQLGGTLFILPVFVVLLIWFYQRRKFEAARLLLFIVGGAGVINMTLKLLFHRARPALWQALVTEHSFSFPSGHAMASSALAFAVMAICWRTKWKWHAVILGSLYILMIGFTRLYLGVHYPSDIIGGWCISLAWALVVYRTLRDRRL